MKLDDLEHAWAQHAPGPGSPASPAVVTRLRREADAAARRFRGMMVMAALLLFLGWAVTLFAHLTGLKRFTLLQAATQLAGSAFYLTWWVIALRSKRAVARERELMGGTMRDSLGASLRTVRLQIQNYRIAGFVLPLAVLVTSALSFAKARAGELPPFGSLLSLLLLAALALIVGVAMWVRYRRELRPRRDELERELQAMDADGNE